MSFVLHTLAWLDRRASLLISAGLVIGVALPDLARISRPLLAPAVIVLLAATLLRLDWPRVIAYLRRPLKPLIVVLWLMLGAPLVMWAIVRVVAPPPGLATALVLMASSPVLVAVPAFALMLGLDAALALVAMVATSLLLPLVQPPLALWLLGVELDIGLLALMTRLALFIGGATLVAVLVRLWAGPKRIARAGSAIGGVVVLMLIVFGVAVMDGMTETFVARPGHVLLFLAAAFAGNFVLQAIGAALFWGGRAAWGLDPAQGLAAALCSGNRNLAILVAVLGERAGADLSLYLACGQFPLYLVPALLGPLYRRLVGHQGAKSG
jgi:BASS family bile acid:Na+ symporter